jgi:CheY-like chemotaxis protein
MSEKGKKILIIDDERSIVIYLTTVLEDHGYVALSALDAEEGAVMARRERPDLVCMDIMMPKRSGIALYQEFKRDPVLGSIPVVFISAFNHIRDLRDPVAFRKMIPDAKVPQPEACLEKPIQVPTFIATIEGILEG